ncbi:hypothetical protein GJ496_002795 [Pomphorhynchus laevis]|nr:hypothetical protein GJ496_002795 [Pomphorhynchus laevis]
MDSDDDQSINFDPIFPILNNSSYSEELPVITPKLTVKEILAIPTYPLYFAKTLIQLGYEPLPPYKAKSLFGFGSTRMYLPGVFTYMRYIYIVDGPSGLFRGLGCSIVNGIVMRWTNSFTKEYIEDRIPYSSSNKSSIAKFTRKTMVEIVASSWAVLLSQPFYIMTIRCMSQFIGGETVYSSFNIFKNLSVIYDNHGFQGFFVGFVPRLCLEASTIIMFNALVECGKKFVPHNMDKDDRIENFITILSRIFVTSVTYPLALVSTISVINNCGLDAGIPPLMPIYKNWCEILNDLTQKGHINRGSRLFIRPYKTKLAIN